MVSGSQAIFLDRDGVLNELVPDSTSAQSESPLNVGDVRLVPGVETSLRRLRAAGFALFCVTNQPAAAKGTVPLPQLQAIHDAVLRKLKDAGVPLQGSRICYHHPEGSVPELARRCRCRKPAPGMLLELAREFDLDLAASWLVGDTDSDVAAGAAAGCRTVLIDQAGSAHKRSGGARPDAEAKDLAHAVRLIVARTRDC
jgi:D-glycero-D-manno-heptose 1,7-bisphosphate phosphatase